MAGLEDFAVKAKDALKSEQAEGVSDNVLDGASDLSNKVTGGKFADQVKGVRDPTPPSIGECSSVSQSGPGVGKQLRQRGTGTPRFLSYTVAVNSSMSTRHSVASDSARQCTAYLSRVELGGISDFHR